MRINEIAKPKVSDLVRATGELKTTFSIKGANTKTDAPRAAFLLIRKQRGAIESLLEELMGERICLSGQSEYRGLNKDWPLIAITKKSKS